MGENIAGLNLILLGKTGAGKSAAGNTILGQEVFVSKKTAKSVTQDVSKGSTTVCGCPVTVYDTPGFFDTDMNVEKVQQMINEKVLQKCESGLCVFLLVIKADRFTEEERKTVEKIEKLLGQNRLEKTWILFTRGDELEEENMTIKEFINDTELLKNLVQKYDQRYHVFNNKKKKHTGQVQTLITKFLTSFKTMVKGVRLNPLKRKLPKQVEQDTPADSLPSRRIVLLGKTGVGKSAAGNTILGQKEFKSVMGMNAVTSECSVAHATVSGRSVSVVDTPGFFDTEMKHEELAIEIAKSVYISSPGPHAFIIVFPVNMRFTEQEQQIPQMIEMMFGQEVLKYSIVLFTHGDQLKRQNIQKLIEKNRDLRHLIDQCGGRYHVFNNKNKRKRAQVNDLLQKIDTMIEQNGGGHYSNQMFEDAERLRREEEEQRQREEEERRQREEEKRQREEEERRQREEEKRQREEEERKQQFKKQVQEEIEKVKKETEERIRAECEAELKSEQERLQAQIQSENNETKKQEQQQDKIDNVETDETISAENKSEQGTCSFFKNFWSRYREHFYMVAGAVIGGAVIGGAVIGGAIIFGAAIGGAVIGGAVIGGLAGLIGGAVAGRSVAGHTVAGCVVDADVVDSDVVDSDVVDSDVVDSDVVDAEAVDADVVDSDVVDSDVVDADVVDSEAVAGGGVC